MIQKETLNTTGHLLLKIIIRIMLILILLGLLFFLTAGTLNYREAWIYIAVVFIPAIFIIGYFYLKDPEFIGGRILKRREKEESPKTIQKIFSLVFLVALLIPGLDFRFNWSEVPVWLVLISDIMVLAGYIFMARVWEENRYASAIIEITKEQKVIDTGPYKVVRHPMYLGGASFILFTPLALGSWWALIPFSFMTITALVMRIKDEEKFLKKNLPGYTEYCRKTRYRIIPFIW